MLAPTSEEQMQPVLNGLSDFVDKLNSLAPLTDEEKNSIKHLLAVPPKRLQRSAVLFAPGDAIRCAYVILDGWAMWHEIFPDGTRQVFDILVPGDVCGFETMLFERIVSRRGVGPSTTGESDLCVSAVTDLLVIPVDGERFDLFTRNMPELAMLMLTSRAVQRSQRLRRRLTAAGQLSARARIADFLLESWQRQMRTHDTDTNRFELPLNQSEIGDLLGLASAYISRILGEMQSAGLIEVLRNGTCTIVIHDPRKLRRVAEDRDTKTD